MCKTGGLELFKITGNHNMPPRATDVEYGVAGFGICPTVTDSGLAQPGLIEKGCVGCQIDKGDICDG